MVSKSQKIIVADPLADGADALVEAPQGVRGGARGGVRGGVSGGARGGVRAGQEILNPMQKAVREKILQRYKE